MQEGGAAGRRRAENFSDGSPPKALHKPIQIAYICLEKFEILLNTGDSREKRL